jgi:FkbM family methyltransferase
MIIFDVGSNTGLSTREYISNTNVIYAFEPVPHLFQNYLYPLRSTNYYVIEKAVSDFDGQTSFNIAKQDPSLTDGSLFGCSSLYEFSDDLNVTWPGRQDFEITETIDVEVIRMDTFISSNHIAKIDYLHCDTQGNDLKVLKSFGEYIGFLNSGKVECVKQNSLYKDVDNDLNSVINFLKDKGFKINEVQSNDDFDNEVNVIFSRS